MLLVNIVTDGVTMGSSSYLYQSTDGAIVIMCQRLWASTDPNHGAKSKSSMLIAIMTHATTKPGHMAHPFRDLR